MLGYLAAFGFVLALGLERVHVADGLRSLAGRRGLRRLRPALAGTFSAKYGTPINVNFTSGVLSTIVFIFASQLGGDAAKIFTAMIGVVLLFTTMSYILIFPT